MMDLSVLHNMLVLPAAPPGFLGVAVGIVTNNQDDEKLGRVKVKLPWLSEEDESDWLRVVAPMAGNERGCYFLPEVNDEVLVAFDHADPQHAFVLGSLWNGKDKPPANNEDGKNNKRLLKSRSGHLICLDDTDNAAKIEIVAAGGKSSIVIDAQENTITISADADLVIQSANGKLKLSGKGVEITSQAEVKIEASQNLDLKAGPQLNIKSQMVNIN